MKRFYRSLIFVAAASWGAAQAQDAPSSAFTLQQCIDYALTNSITIQNSFIDQEIASAKVKETIGIGLPQINGDFGVNDNTQLQRFFTRYTGPGGFVGDLSAVPGIKVGDVVAAPNFFQLPVNSAATISVSQILFSGSYLVGLRASNTFKELSVKQGNQTKEQVIEQTTKAFYSALINQERMKLFTNNIARVDSLLKNTKALNVNGFAEEIDVDRIQVTLNNLITERDKFERLQKLSLELLKFQMSYPMDKSIDVQGDLSTLNSTIDLTEYLREWDYKNRPDFQALETSRKLQALNVRNKYASGMPSLSASANFGYGTQSSTISGLFRTESGFNEVTNPATGQSIGPDRWYGQSILSLNLHVPLFSGLQRNYQIQQEKLNLNKVDNNAKILKSSIDLQIKQGVTNYENSLQALESQKRNMTLAEKVAKVTKVKYSQGVGSNIEVVDAESSLKEAQINYYNALYDLLVSKVDIDKAFGKILTNQNTKK